MTGYELSETDVILTGLVSRLAIEESGRFDSDRLRLSLRTLCFLLREQDCTDDEVVVVVTLPGCCLELIAGSVPLLFVSMSSLESSMSSSLKAMSKRRELFDSFKLTISGLLLAFLLVLFKLEQDEFLTSSTSMMAVLSELVDRLTTTFDFDLRFSR